MPEIEKGTAMRDDRAGHYLSVARKPITGRLLLSRACFLFGF